MKQEKVKPSPTSLPVTPSPILIGVNSDCREEVRHLVRNLLEQHSIDDIHVDIPRGAAGAAYAYTRSLGCEPQQAYEIGSYALLTATLYHLIDDIMDEGKMDEQESLALMNLCADRFLGVNELNPVTSNARIKAALVISDEIFRRTNREISEIYIRTWESARDAQARSCIQRRINVSWEEYIEIARGKNSYAGMTPIASFELAKRPFLTRDFIEIGVYIQLLDDVKDFQEDTLAGCANGVHYYFRKFSRDPDAVNRLDLLWEAGKYEEVFIFLSEQTSVCQDLLDYALESINSYLKRLAEYGDTDLLVNFINYFVYKCRRVSQ